MIGIDETIGICFPRLRAVTPPTAPGSRLAAKPTLAPEPQRARQSPNGTDHAAGRVPMSSAINGGRCITSIIAYAPASAGQGSRAFPVVLPDPSGAPDPRTKSKGQCGPFCAVGCLVGEHSRDTGMKPGGSYVSVSLTARACQQESPSQVEGPTDSAGIASVRNSQPPRRHERHRGGTRAIRQFGDREFQVARLPSCPIAP